MLVRLRTLEEDLIELQGLLEVLEMGDLFDRLATVREEVLEIGLALARAEFVARCLDRNSALGEPADLVDLVSCLPGG